MPTPTELRAEFERRVLQLPDVSVGLWKDADLVCIFYGENELAHFHGETVLDLRLSPKIIREEKLSRLVSTRIHPQRSQNSRWIGVELETWDDIDVLVQLVRRGCVEVS